MGVVGSSVGGGEGEAKGDTEDTFADPLPFARLTAAIDLALGSSSAQPCPVGVTSAKETRAQSRKEPA